MKQKSLFTLIINHYRCWQKDLIAKKRALQEKYQTGRLFSKVSIPLTFFIIAIFLTIALVIFLDPASAQVSSWTPVQISLPPHLSEKITNQTMPSNGDPHRSTIETDGWTTIFSDDFEGDFPGEWFVDDVDGAENGEYYWGKRNCLSHSGSFSAWAVGGGDDGSSLSCGSDYPINANSWMIYGPFSLEGATSAEFSFNYWLNSESGYDFFKVLASINGSYFYGYEISGERAAWYGDVFDLTDVYMIGDLTGQPQVWIAFLFTSDDSINCEAGVYVDDVVIRASVSQSFTITASAGVNGGISPSGNVTVIKGQDQTFNITPDPGYQVAFVDVDGFTVGALTQYTFTNVQSNHTIYASFDSFSLEIFLPLILNQITLPPPGIPVLNKINNPAGGNDYTVNWQSAANAINYILQEADNNNFTGASTVFDGPNTSVNITGKDVGTYFYRVKSKNAAHESAWSNIESVEVTVEMPDTPVPGNWSGITNQGLNISWTVSDDGTAISNLTLDIYWDGECGAYGSTNFLFTTTINDNKFSKTQSDLMGGFNTVSGTFTSTTSSEGTWSSKFVTYLPYSFDKCTATKNGTWTASASE